MPHEFMIEGAGFGQKEDYMDVLKCARSMADAMAYCHGRAIPNAMVMHGDLKPDNIGE